MKNVRLMLYSLSLFFFLAVASSCKNNKKTLNERQTLWRKDKIPYGTKYAYDQLKYLFPKAEIVADRAAPVSSGLFPESDKKLKAALEANKGNTARIIICQSIYPTEDEILAMLGFVWEGNQLFLSANNFDEVLLDSLHLKVSNNFHGQEDSLSNSLLNPDADYTDTLHFSYPGKGNDDYFSDMDSTYTTILGYNRYGKPNFVKIVYVNGGAIYFHLQPQAFSNFFLLHKNNKRYYDLALSQIPARMKLVNWNDYFRDNTEGKSISTIRKSFQWVLSQPPLAWALWILLALFVLIYLLGTKRRQREIPLLPPLKNSSLDFVRTIGQLYYQKRDHRNLALKISTHFLDHVRARYNIQTSHLDQQFIQRLSFKAGVDQDLVNELIEKIHYFNLAASISEMELLEFNQMIENFYKKA